jgi:hypothetical protein
MDKINMYLESLYLQEDLIDILPKFNATKIAKKIQANLDSANPKDSAKKISRFIPKINPALVPKIDSFMSSKDTEYNKLHNRASIVLKNSLDNVSQKMANLAATFLVVSSMYAPRQKRNISHEQNLNSNLKEFITRVRKFGSEHEDDEENRKLRSSDYIDLSVAWVIVVMGSALAISLGSGSYAILTALATAFASGVSLIFHVAIIVGIVIVGLWIYLNW